MIDTEITVPICARPVAALNTDNGREMRPCVRPSGHISGVCRYDGSDGLTLALFGPGEGADAALALLGIAAELRSWGHDVSTAADCARTSSATVGSMDHLHACMAALIDSSGLVLAPGWATDPRCVASRHVADSIGLAVIEWPDAA